MTRLKISCRYCFAGVLWAEAAKCFVCALWYCRDCCDLAEMPSGARVRACHRCLPPRAEESEESGE